MIKSFLDRRVAGGRRAAIDNPTIYCHTAEVSNEQGGRFAPESGASAQGFRGLPGHLWQDAPDSGPKRLEMAFPDAGLHELRRERYWLGCDLPRLSDEELVPNAEEILVAA